EFESGRFFNAKVLSNMRRIGIYTEIACYFFIPLAVVADMPNLARSDIPLQFVLSISYAGGAAGTFIRYFSRLIPIGRALEESYELTV
ncbi:MAG: hypothetical protein M3Q07_14320, partial [Pseudobdellovibrionaceae bacterium]|nr:hypothetical protein [Pseudobdellovibrionaceae bacterium]